MAKAGKHTDSQTIKFLIGVVIVLLILVLLQGVVSGNVRAIEPIGEGGSGGALGIGVGDRFAIMEYAYCSVISPEGCAAILWKDASHAPLAAEALKLTAKELLRLEIVDDIIPEPPGAAHTSPREAAATLKKALQRYLKEVTDTPLDILLDKRYGKYRRMGKFFEQQPQQAE